MSRAEQHFSDVLGRLAELPAPEQVRVLTDLVCAETEAALRAIRRESATPVDAERSFQEQGLDSLGLVTLQRGVNDATGLTLPPTIGFDHPTPATLAVFLRAELLGEAGENDGDPVGSADPAEGHPAADDSDPVVIVGIGCHFPGGIDSADDLWQLVADGREVLGDFPTDRDWGIEHLFDADPDAPHRSYADKGGFLAGAAEFDADFFGISPREALTMDPQQRLMLETAWETLERAGIDPTSLRSSRTGVFVGAEAQEYGPRTHEAPEGLDGYVSNGNALSFTSGRVSYSLGLEGPAVTVDTACSGSIVALHLAVQAVRRGECSLALAGGVAVMGGTSTFTTFSRQRGLAPDGRVKAFAAAADGTGFSEGIGLLVVERLSDAREQGHTVLAVVRGTAVNQDGASNGLTAPSGTAQRRLIRQALATAGLTAADVDAVDAHGTGTTLGDPIEAQALIATYGQDRPQDRPLWLGSLKSNLGHAQAAGGVASVIKMIMGMRHRVLPRTLNVDEPSPHIEWSAGHVKLLTEARPWPEHGRPRRAGVSAFGISGTNAHVIIEEPAALDAAHHAPDEAPDEAPDAPAHTAIASSSARTGDGDEIAPGPGPLPVVVSAKSAPALRAQAERLLELLRQDPTASLVDVGYSLATTRASLGHRAVVLAADRPGLERALRAVAGDDADQRPPGLFLGTPAAGRLAFLFTGQGSQRLAMGRELHSAYPVFAEAFDEAVAHLDLQLDVSLWDVLFAEPGTPEAGLLDETMYAQCALFAVETALFRLVESWGVRPDFLAGHSVGELAAAHAAGVFSIEDAAILVGARARLMQELPRDGAMVAVQAGEAEVLEAIAGLHDRVSVAAVNGPESVVLSGDEACVLAVAAELADRGRKFKRLKVSHAFHSPLMEPMLEEFEQVARVVRYSEPRIPVISDVTGRPATAERLRSPGYWVEHVRASVRFADTVTFLRSAGVTTFLELGPDAVLSAMGPDNLTEAEAGTTGVADAVFVPALRRDRDERHEVLSAVARIAARGHRVRWEAHYTGLGARRLSLPTYPFQRRHYWLGGAKSEGDAGQLGQIAADHPLLGSVVHLAHGDGIVLTGRISLSSHPWLTDHVIAGVPLLPGTAFVELALRAGLQTDCDLVEELTLQVPLVLSPATGTDLQIVVSAADTTGRRTVAFYARPVDAAADAEWTRHAAGVLTTSGTAAPTAADFGMVTWPPTGAEPVDVSTLYETMRDEGYEYGPAFRGLRAAWRRGDEVFAEVALPEETSSDNAAAGGFGFHPALLDAVLHATEFTMPQDRSDAIRLPFGWTGVMLHATGASAVRVRLTATGSESVSLTIADTTGSPVARADSFVLRPVDTDRLVAARQESDTLLRVGWRPLDVPAPDPASPGPVPTPVFAELMDLPADTVPDGVREYTTRALELLQRWSTDEQHAHSTLVIVTRRAVAADPRETPDLAAAPVWGLVRSAQAEQPGRYVLIDTDGPVDPAADLMAAALSGEPELALREGRFLVPRLTPMPPAPQEQPSVWGGGGTVLVTGGTGGLGGLVARHLVVVHG
ncbi:beta-ketoacyl synthase N-terminal-like domain-containing protein, partial [Streptomyces phaeochromogenes]|uniref:type I polyketide synthase n=1 Tax=Streptomyces phaeochromogenes TaxID=1923 RepID=UPI0036A63ACB